jgi:D-arginine dehydrogenase
VQALTRASQPEFARLQQEPGTSPLLTPRGLLLTAWDDAATAGLRAQLEAATDELRTVPPDRVRKVCPALITDGLQLAVLDETAQDIDVMGLHAAYVRRVRGDGGAIHCGASVVEVIRRSNGWRVCSADGRQWDADVLVNAAGAWADEFLHRCDLRGFDLSPRRRTIVVSRPQPPVDARWPVIAEANEEWYFKPEGNGVLLSPGDETPTTAGDARPDPSDIAIALDRVNARTTLQLRSVQTAWAGLRTFAPDRAPVVGPHPDEPTLFCLVGQGGYGIQTAPALAGIAAQKIRGIDGDSADSRLHDAISPERFAAAAAPYEMGQLT